VKFNPVA